MSTDSVPVPPSAQRRPANWMIGAGAFVVAVILAVVLAVATQSHGFTLKGGLVLTDTDVTLHAGDVCSGKGGYDDIAGGTSVVITDAAGKTIGLGSLRDGKVVDATDCAFFFTVKDVPDGLKFYGIQISRRGTVPYSLDEMKKGPVLSLGDD